MGVCVVVLIVANPSGSKKPHGVNHPVPVTNEVEKVPPETKTPPPPPTPKPTPTKRVYESEITFERDAGYNIDQLPITRDKPSGFTFAGPSEGHFEVVGGGKVALWTGKGPPNFASCDKTLASSGTEKITLNEPGQWICAETEETTELHYVARLRYDGESSKEVYRFFAAVYRRGHS